jgi:hypothetical protein
METMKLPESWKEANVTPIQKKGPKNLVENDRPISLTSIVCKTMDKFIRYCILDHMERHNIYTTDQHGFRKGKYCATQLIEVLDNWTEQLDNRNAIDIIYGLFSFVLVFDCMNFQKILLSSYILMAIERSYSYFAFLTKRLASFLASSCFILLLLINLVYSL